ncbi:MAG: glutaredoxin, partial [Steroidobacteraceae bacterium]|nr:glutaredoxin [Steroidobacteraceae bacterium]
PVTLFALEWCEFCWSVRRLFAKHGIPYRSVDLDSVDYQRDDRGAKIRAALTARTSVATIPQIFVGGEFLGGCTDLFEAYSQGRFQQLLRANNVVYDETVNVDPYSFLPTWLHPR